MTVIKSNYSIYQYSTVSRLRTFTASFLFLFFPLLNYDSADKSCYVSIQGLHPSKVPAFLVFEGESFGETLLTASTVAKCDSLAFVAFPGCVTRCFILTSQFLPPRPAKVTIYATQCLHFLSFFLFGRTKNLGICEATKDSNGASSKKREKKAAFEGAFKSGQPSCSILTYVAFKGRRP